MQAIEVKFIGPTNYKGARLVARCQAKRKIYSWGQLEHELYAKNLPTNPDVLARLAAEKLRDELEWTKENGYGDLHAGDLPNGAWVFVFVRREENHAK